MELVVFFCLQILGWPFNFLELTITRQLPCFCRVMKVARSFLDAGHKLNFAVASRKTFGHELSEFGLDGSTSDVPLVAIRTAKGEKFAMQEEFS